MTAVAVVLSIVAMPAALGISFGLSAIGQWLGNQLREDRLTRTDLQWLAGQGETGQS